MAASRIPARFTGRTFENFCADSDEKRHALTVCRDFAENFAEHSRKGASLILSGKPGTGLGLAIVREIAHGAGGEVDILDTPDGRGVLLRVSLPALIDTPDEEPA